MASHGHGGGHGSKMAEAYHALKAFKASKSLSCRYTWWALGIGLTLWVIFQQLEITWESLGSPQWQKERPELLAVLAFLAPLGILFAIDLAKILTIDLLTLVVEVFVGVGLEVRDLLVNFNHKYKWKKEPARKTVTTIVLGVPATYLLAKLSLRATNLVENGEAWTLSFKWVSLAILLTLLAIGVRRMIKENNKGHHH